MLTWGGRLKKVMRTKTRDDAAKTLWRDYLKKQSKTLEVKSRRKQMGDGGSKQNLGKQPDKRTDPDELGYYDSPNS